MMISDAEGLKREISLALFKKYSCKSALTGMIALFLGLNKLGPCSKSHFQTPVKLKAVVQLA